MLFTALRNLAALSSKPMVSYETIRRWVGCFGPAIVRRLRAGRSAPQRRWHLDKMRVRIGGRPICLWRAVDAEGEVLDVLVQAKRDKAAASKLIRKLLRNSRLLRVSGSPTSTAPIAPS